MSTCLCSKLYLPTYVYLSLYIYIIAADPGARTGLVFGHFYHKIFCTSHCACYLYQIKLSMILYLCEEDFTLFSTATMMNCNELFRNRSSWLRNLESLTWQHHGNSSPTLGRHYQRLKRFLCPKQNNYEQFYKT